MTGCARSVVHSGAPRTFAAGLDYFVLELLVLGLVLIPLEGVVAWREQRAVAAQPLRLQLPQMLLLIELATYWVHRAFHALPWLCASMPSTLRARRWTGWPARACIRWTC